MGSRLPTWCERMYCLWKHLSSDSRCGYSRSFTESQWLELTPKRKPAPPPPPCSESSQSGLITWRLLALRALLRQEVLAAVHPPGPLTASGNTWPRSTGRASGSLLADRYSCSCGAAATTSTGPHECLPRSSCSPLVPPSVPHCPYLDRLLHVGSIGWDACGTSEQRSELLRADRQMRFMARSPEALPSFSHCTGGMCSAALDEMPNVLAFCKSCFESSIAPFETITKSHCGRHTSESIDSDCRPEPSPLPP